MNNSREYSGFPEERAHRMPKRMDENETHSEARHHEISLGTKRKSFHHMEELQISQQQALKTISQWSKAFKAEGRIFLIQNSVSSYCINQVGRQNKNIFRHPRSQKIYPPWTLFQKTVAKHAPSNEMKGGKQEKIYGPHETEDSTRRGAEGICQFMEKTDPMLTTLHKAQKVLLENLRPRTVEGPHPQSSLPAE